MTSSEPIPIPVDLAENVARGSCVLFLGADATLGDPGPPTRAQLAAALAQKYEWVTPGQAWPLAAEEYLSREAADHHGLTVFVRDRCADLNEAGPLHKLVIELGFDAIVTNAYDDLMETAMRQAGRRVLQVVGDVEIAFAGTGEEAIIIRLAGSVSQPNSLVLTFDDQLEVEIDLAERLQAVRGWCMLRPLLFVGWDPDDESLLRLYKAATRKLGQHKRRNYIVWPSPSQRALSLWGRYNVEIISAEPLSFLRALRRAAKQQRLLVGMPGYQPGEVVGKLPYKFLNYFDPDDRDIFCGREVEAPLVYRMALSYPLLTLFGQSGVGKTSLLRAGVVPLLVQEGYRYAYVRTLGDPLQSIREQVCAALELEGCAGTTLLDFFQSALGEEGKLMVVLDQFEELFTRPLSETTRRQFWRQLGACIGLTGPEVRFILCLREDFLAHLDEARRPPAEGEPGPVPYILRNSYRLIPLNTDTAYLAIVEPARRARCEVEPLLADVLLGRAAMPGMSATPVPAGTEDGQEMARPAWSLVELDGKVPPPSLQIVMDRLYRAALAEGHHAPPVEGEAGRGWKPPRLDLSLDLYRRLGGAGQILGGYVPQALDDVGRADHGGDRNLAVALLKVMVTSQKTKAALSEPELVRGLAEAEADFEPERDRAALRATLAAVVNLRLVRSFQVGEQALYELAHDHMAAKIATWIGETEMKAKLARELLRREMESWKSMHKLIDPAALNMIHERRDDLRRLEAGELELLFRSALAAGVEVPYWFERACQEGVPADEIALEGLRSAKFRTRAAAGAALGELREQFADALVPMLADDYPQVRAAAIRALERLQPDGAWRRHLKHECYVPAGDFVMGDDKSDRKDEKPAHRVILGAFYIGKYPVTNADYKRYMDDRERVFDIPPGKADHPVVSIPWYDARDYAAWAGMRLLTEAEWEKAASWDAPPQSPPQGGKPAGQGGRARFVDRLIKGKETEAGKKLAYPWGDKFDKNRCNTHESGIEDTTPVGKYSPAGDSPHGCADMAGNVWEWTSSLYNDYPYRADDGREDPHSSDFRVLRGGSWYIIGDGARSAFRNYGDPDCRNLNYGVRLGLSSTSSL